MTILAIQHPSTETFQQLYDAAIKQWTGCNWRTDLGPLRLNLMGIHSRQARLIAEATSGEESVAWEEATKFLSQVEVDSRAASKAAENAIRLIAEGKLAEAIADAERAIALEAKYREPKVWKPLRDAICG